MKKEPTISIIMASYNHADFIGKAIESVQQQDYNSWELLIADDSSTDNTLKVLDSYTNDTRVKVFPFKINRQYHMRNFAAKHASGDYIAFLNSDDIFLPGKLRKQVEYLEKNPLTAAVFTYVKGINEDSQRLSDSHLEKVFAVKNCTRHEWLKQFFISRNCLCISSVLIRRNCFETVNAFNPLLIQISDLELWIKICFKWDIYVITEQLTGMRLLKGGKNLSASGYASASRAFIEYQRVYDHYFSADGLSQILEIFPELTSLLPEDTLEWRYYHLCRIAIFLYSKPMRLIGFIKLHELLKAEETKNMLLQKNPRLLRTLFLSEGTSGLRHEIPSVMWKIALVEQNDLFSKEKSYSYWTNSVNTGVVCFSFPNPGTSEYLHVSIESYPAPIRCVNFRLYNQETGDIIFDSGKFLQYGKNRNTSGPDKVVTRYSDYNDYYFPEIDFTELTSRNIDIEIEYAPVRFYTFFKFIKKMFGKKCSKLLTRMFQRLYYL